MKSGSEKSLAQSFFLPLTLLLTMQPASADEILQMELPNGCRVITATGTGSVKTSPDTATISLGVRTFSKDLRDGFKENDTILKRIIAVPTKYHVKKSDIQTSEIRVSDLSKGSYEGKVRTNKIERRITISVHDFEIIPQLLVDVVDAGTNTIDSVEFSVSETRKFKDQARILAVKAASEKASSMAAQLNAKIGKPLMIKELDAFPRSFSRNYSNHITVVEPEADEVDATTDGIAKGLVRIDASVSVTFELID